MLLLNLPKITVEEEEFRAHTSFEVDEAIRSLRGRSPRPDSLTAEKYQHFPVVFTNTLTAVFNPGKVLQSFN